MVTRPGNARLIVEVKRTGAISQKTASMQLDHMLRQADLLNPWREVVVAKGHDVYVATLLKEDTSSPDGVTRNPLMVGARLSHLAETFQKEGRTRDVIRFYSSELAELRSEGDLANADNPTVCALVKMSGEACHVDNVLPLIKDKGNPKLKKLRTPRPYVMLELLAHLSSGVTDTLGMPDVHWILLATKVFGEYPVLQISNKPNTPSSFHYCDGEIGKRSLRGPGLVVFATSVS